MPTYEYECTSCGHGFEVFQSMSDQPLKDCPECGKGIRRLILGGAGIIFKGSGFYVTDKGKATSSGAAKKGTAETCSGCPATAACPASSPTGGGEAAVSSSTETKTA